MIQNKQMMKKLTLLLGLFLFIPFSMLKAQSGENEKLKTRYTIEDDPSEGIDNFAFSKLYNVSTIGILSGSSSNRQPAPFSFQTLMLFPFDEQLAFGFGLGVDFLEETYMPAVFDFRYYSRKGRFSPFVFAQAGYSFPTEKAANQNVINDNYQLWPNYYPQVEEVKPKGGVLINPGFGVRHMFHPDFGMEISFSYRYQMLNYEYKASSRIEANYNRLNIRIGILFQ
jgi:hypothetical protein